MNENIQKVTEFNVMKKGISGATWVAKDNNPHPNMIANNDGVDFNVVEFPLQNNQPQHVSEQKFVAIANVEYDQRSVDVFCQKEIGDIRQGVTGNCTGPVSGVFQLCDESNIHADVTQKPTSLKLSSSS